SRKLYVLPDEEPGISGVADHVHKPGGGRNASTDMIAKLREINNRAKDRTRGIADVGNGYCATTKLITGEGELARDLYIPRGKTAGALKSADDARTSRHAEIDDLEAALKISRQIGERAPHDYILRFSPSSSPRDIDTPYELRMSEIRRVNHSDGSAL